MPVYLFAMEENSPIESAHGFYKPDGALNHRSYIVAEVVFTLVCASIAGFLWAGVGGFSAAFWTFAALSGALITYKTAQIFATLNDAPNRIDRGQVVVAQLSGRQFKPLSWARRPLLIVLSEHYLYVFESTIRRCDPIARRAYNDLMEFGLGDGTQRAVLRIGLPDRTFAIAGVIGSEVVPVEAMINIKRPLLIKEPIAPALEAMLDD